MLCDQCRRNIADDSVYCSYCGAHQPTPDAQTNSPNFEPYVPGLGRRIFGWLVTAVILACLVGIVYLLSSTGTAPNFGSIAFLE
jgi:hypothetical protein